MEARLAGSSGDNSKEIRGTARYITFDAAVMRARCHSLVRCIQYSAFGFSILLQTARGCVISEKLGESDGEGAASRGVLAFLLIYRGRYRAIVSPSGPLAFPTSGNYWIAYEIGVKPQRDLKNDFVGRYSGEIGAQT